MISPDALKGYILEEVLARLIRGAGYRLLTKRSDDPHDLDMFHNGLVVRGRGAYHQADVLGELLWAPAFGSPIRLFLEAKWRGINGRGRFNNRVGLKEARQAVGVIQDVNQMLATVSKRQDNAPPIRPGTHEYIIDQRIFSYNYRYVLFSTSGFTKPSQAYALAHQINLVDLSSFNYERLLQNINDCAERAVEELSSEGISTAKIMAAVRSVMRNELWLERHEPSERGLYEFFRNRLQSVIASTIRISDLFFGITSTGFVLLLKADDPIAMIRMMGARQDPDVDITWELDSPLDWTISLYERGSTDASAACRLQFRLPEYLLDALTAKADREQLELAIDFKENYFSRITVIHITSEKSMMCALRIRNDKIREARQSIRSK